jgi:hypothetical protein
MPYDQATQAALALTTTVRWRLIDALPEEQRLRIRESCRILRVRLLSYRVTSGPR